MTSRDEIAGQRLAQDFLLALLGEQLRFVEGDVARHGNLFVVDQRLSHRSAPRTSRDR